MIGIPRTTPHLPRERPNPLLAAYLGLGLALRLWRDAFPLVEGGTAILLHRFHRHFSHPTQQPYRAIFQAARASGGRAGGAGPTPSARLRPTNARSPRTAPAARATRCCRSPTGPAARRRSSTARLGARRRLPRRRRRPPARLRPDPRPGRRARDGARPRRRSARASATCCRRRTFRCGLPDRVDRSVQTDVRASPHVLERASQATPESPCECRLSPRRGRPCGPARSRAGSSRRRRARSAPVSST